MPTEPDTELSDAEFELRPGFREDLPDLQAATTGAIGDIRSIMASDIETGHLDLRGWIEIADEEGQALAQVRYCEAIVIIPDE